MPYFTGLHSVADSRTWNISMRISALTVGPAAFAFCTIFLLSNTARALDWRIIQDQIGAQVGPLVYWPSSTTPLNRSFQIEVPISDGQPVGEILLGLFSGICGLKISESTPPCQASITGSHQRQLEFPMDGPSRVGGLRSVAEQGPHPRTLHIYPPPFTDFLDPFLFFACSSR